MRKFIRGTVENAALAFVGTFAPLFTSFSAAESAAYAGGSAALLVVLSALAALTGHKGVPSFDPANVGAVDPAHRR